MVFNWISNKETCDSYHFIFIFPPLYSSNASAIREDYYQFPRLEFSYFSVITDPRCAEKACFHTKNLCSTIKADLQLTLYYIFKSKLINLLN